MDALSQVNVDISLEVKMESLSHLLAMSQLFSKSGMTMFFVISMRLFVKATSILRGQ